MSTEWKVGGWNGLLKDENTDVEHHPELERWLRVVSREEPYEEFLVGAYGAEKLAETLDAVESLRQRLQRAESLLERALRDSRPCPKCWSGPIEEYGALHGVGILNRNCPCPCHADEEWEPEAKQLLAGVASQTEETK